MLWRVSHNQTIVPPKSKQSFLHIFLNFQPILSALDKLIYFLGSKYPFKSDYIRDDTCDCFSLSFFDDEDMAYFFQGGVVGHYFDLSEGAGVGVVEVEVTDISSVVTE